MSGDGLILPDDEDSESVDRSDIDRVLPQPRSLDGTARVALKLRFDANLDDIAQNTEAIIMTLQTQEQHTMIVIICFYKQMFCWARCVEFCSFFPIFNQYDFNTVL